MPDAPHARLYRFFGGKPPRQIVRSGTLIHIQGVPFYIASSVYVDGVNPVPQESESPRG